MSKAYVLKCAAFNLGLLLRKIWGLSKPRSVAGLLFALWLQLACWRDRSRTWAAHQVNIVRLWSQQSFCPRSFHPLTESGVY